jgi:hypothetical protein
LWIDGGAALLGAALVLGARHVLADLHRLPLQLLTIIGFVNLAYALVGLTLARTQRRRVWQVTMLALANWSWAIVCVLLAARFGAAASALGLAHLLFEGTFVAALGAVELRNRSTLAR